MQQSNSVRDEYIDFLKGLAILLVVAGHSIVELRQLTPLFNFIYSFHIPLLFFLSGYIEEKTCEKYKSSKFQMLLRRTKSLLIPYFIWTILFYLLRNGTHGFLAKDLFLRLCGYDQDCLWFLAVTWGLKCLHTAFWHLSTRLVSLAQAQTEHIMFPFISLGIIELSTILLALITGHPTLISMVTYAVPYFLGVMLIRSSLVKTIVSRKLVIVFCLICYVLLFPFFSFHNVNSITQILRIMLSSCVIILLYNLRNVISSLKTLPLLNLFGRHSLEIYLLQTFFIDHLKFVYQYTDSVILLSILGILSAFIVCFLSIVLARAITLIPYASKLLFGK